jgi:hypothetical protein
MLHMTDGVMWRSDRTYTPSVVYYSGWLTPLQMWFDGTDSGNYAIGYAAITSPSPTTTATPTSTSNVTVGGRVGPVNKIAVLAPFFSLILVLAAIIFTGQKLLKHHLR